MRRITANTIFTYVKEHIGNCDQTAIYNGLQEFLDARVIELHLNVHDIIKMSQEWSDVNPPLDEDEAKQVVKLLQEDSVPYHKLAVNRFIWEVVQKRKIP